MPEPLIDHDRLFKELITTHFDDFLAFAAPQILAVIDRDSNEFLDKELYSDLVVGDEHMVDILVRVKIAGEEMFILIHVENQSTSEADFARRMFDYFTRLRARFGIPVYPIAIFSFDTPQRPEPCVYTETTFGLNVVRYEFQPIQLNRMNWRDYIGTDNPVAAALMAKM